MLVDVSTEGIMILYKLICYSCRYIPRVLDAFGHGSDGTAEPMGRAYESIHGVSEIRHPRQYSG